MPASPRYADTKINAEGRRVPVSEFEETEGAARSTKVDPNTRIAADGTRKPMDEIDDNEVAPVGRTAEARMREERAAHIAEAPTPTQPTGATETAADDDAGDEGDEGEKALEDHTVAELKEIASDLEIEGRSGMNKDELIEAIEAAQG